VTIRLHRSPGSVEHDGADCDLLDRVLKVVIEPALRQRGQTLREVGLDRIAREWADVADLHRSVSSDAPSSDIGRCVASGSSDPGSSSRERISTQEAAQRLGIGQRGVVDLCRRGALTAELVAGRWSIDAQSVNDRRNSR